MGRSRKVNWFSMEGVDVRDVAGDDSHFFVNDDVIMVLNGAPHKGHFLRKGEIYHVVEPRIIMVIEGEVNICIDLQDYAVAKGFVIMTCPDAIVEVKSMASDTLVTGIVMREGVQTSEGAVLGCTPDEFSRMLRMASLAWDMMHVEPYRRAAVRSLLEAMVANIRYMDALGKEKACGSRPTRQQEIFQKFKLLVTRHCTNERSIPFYAGQLNVTPHHLSAVIKEASGRSVMYWVNRATVQEAKLLLRMGELMAYEIADRLNFPGASAFSKFFKREVGVTPRQYQEGAGGWVE